MGTKWARSTDVYGDVRYTSGPHLIRKMRTTWMPSVSGAVSYRLFYAQAHVADFRTLAEAKEYAPAQLAQCADCGDEFRSVDADGLCERCAAEQERRDAHIPNPAMDR